MDGFEEQQERNRPQLCPPSLGNRRTDAGFPQASTGRRRSVAGRSLGLSLSQRTEHTIDTSQTLATQATRPLDRGRSTHEAETLRQAAKEATEARAGLKTALAEVRRLLAVDSDLMARAAALQLPAVAAAAEAVLACHPEAGAGSPRGLGPVAAAEAVRACHPEGAAWPSPEGSAVSAPSDEFVVSLSVSVEQLRQAAVESLQTREDTWRPRALTLLEWLPKAIGARRSAVTLPLLKAADKWLKEAADAIRNERFAPIADQTKAIWDQLKLQSHVSLEAVHLGGAGKARKVELNVTVDGQEGAALGVMSQGELHSLALSLFIPRATLPESPFRFIVIDDPVQSMDPARVDGLARVLQAAGKDRQVIVFTHDDRLPEAVRRLGIDATVIEVTRREGSVVEPRRSKDPVSRYIEDAMALAYTDDLPAEVARRVIPGLCREAIEAACMEAIRRRRIGRGEPHAEVEALLTGITSTKALAALALLDDEKRAGDVLPHLNQKSKEGADAFRAVNEGSHGALSGVPIDLVRSAEKLARWMQKLP